MYRQPIHLRYRVGILYCPECYKVTARPIKQFKTVRGLSIHLAHNHFTSVSITKRIKRCARDYIKNNSEVSFITLLFKRGVLY